MQTCFPGPSSYVLRAGSQYERLIRLSLAKDYSSLLTCYHGNIAMQMAVDYSHIHMHRCMFHSRRTLDLRYIPCIGCVTYDLLLIVIYDKEL